MNQQERKQQLSQSAESAQKKQGGIQMETIRELVEITENKPNEDLQTAQWLVATSHPDALEQKNVEYEIIRCLANQLVNMPCSALMTENLGDLFSWQIKRHDSSNCDQWCKLRQDWLKQYPDAGRKNTQIPNAVVNKFNSHLDNLGFYWQINTPWLAENKTSLGTIQLNAINTQSFEQIIISGQLADLTTAGWEKLADWLVKQGVHVEMVMEHEPGSPWKCDHLNLTCHQPAAKTIRRK